MTPSRAARQPCSTIPRSPWDAPRRGAAPRTVRSSLASTMARSASIIVRDRSARLPRGGLLHEAEPVLHLFLFLVHLEEPQVLLDRRADALLERVALDPQV